MARKGVLFEEIVQRVADIVFVVGSDSLIRHCNKSAAICLGVETPQNLRGSDFLLHVSPSSHSDVQELLTSSNSSFAQEFSIIGERGRTITLRGEFYRLAENGSLYTVIIARETEVQESENDLLRFSNVIQNTLHPIQITDLKGRMVFINTAFEKMTGYSRDELIGKNPKVLSSGKHTAEFWKNVWGRVLAGELWIGEIENKRRDGTPIHTELMISPVVNERGEVIGFMGGHRDITDQKFLEQQLLRSQRMESIGTLAAGIAHEVGNPLSAISSVVQLLMRSTKDPFMSDKLELIKSQINRISRIIHDLVDFSRPTTDTKKPTNINAVLKEALMIVQYGKKVSHIRFDQVYDESLPTLFCIPDQMMQVFINILINAVDAIEQEEGAITIITRKTDTHLEVAISDTGKGIPQHSLARVFQPFFSTKEAGKGTGLGLWVSYGIIRAAGGNINVESQIGSGATFTLTFPLKGI